jgi:signal transduction histidine kinase/ActR/RegA family two-component response regulator
MQFRIVRPDGVVRTLREENAFVADEAGVPVRLVGTVQDITERIALEAKLGEAQRMEAVGQLAGGVAHDFNNILTAIRGFSELAAMPDLEPTERAAHLETIITNADRAADLTRGLLAFSRRQLLQPRVLDPASVVEGIAPMLRRLLGPGIVLVIEAPAALGQVRVDPGQLERILLDLAVNARDAMPAGGSLRIEFDDVELDAVSHPEVAPGPYVALSVSDTGRGMDSATVAHVFEPFFTTKGPGGGTGLGLATVYGIVRQSGGSIALESEPGAGTTVHIYLPRVDGEQPAVPSAPRATAAEAGSSTILLVEDDPAVRGFVGRSLASHGHVVLEAPGGPEAIERAAAHEGPIDLLVTDVVMPGMGGPELAERLVATRPGLRVLFISGYAEGHFGSAGPAPGTFYLAKPFSADLLARTVREALGSPGVEGVQDP